MKSLSFWNVNSNNKNYGENRQSDVLYLANEREYKVVDGDISVEGEGEANEEYEVMEEDGWDPPAVESVMQHVPLIVSKVAAREAQGLVRPRPTAPEQLRVLQHPARPILYPLIDQNENHCKAKHSKAQNQSKRNENKHVEL